MRTPSGSESQIGHRDFDRGWCSKPPVRGSARHCVPSYGYRQGPSEPTSATSPHSSWGQPLAADVRATYQEVPAGETLLASPVQDGEQSAHRIEGAPTMKRKTTYIFSVEKTWTAVASPTPPLGPWSGSWFAVRVAGVLVGLAGLTLPHLMS